MKRESERSKQKRKAIRKYKYKYKCNSVVSLVKGKTRCAFVVLVLTSLLQSAFLLYMYKTEQLWAKREKEHQEFYTSSVFVKKAVFSTAGKENCLFLYGANKPQTTNRYGRKVLCFLASSHIDKEIRFHIIFHYFMHKHWSTISLDTHTHEEENKLTKTT